MSFVLRQVRRNRFKAAATDTTTFSKKVLRSGAQAGQAQSQACVSSRLRESPIACRLCSGRSGAIFTCCLCSGAVFPAPGQGVQCDLSACRFSRPGQVAQAGARMQVKRFGSSLSVCRLCSGRSGAIVSSCLGTGHARDGQAACK